MKKQKPQKNVISMEDFIERKMRYFAQLESTAEPIMNTLELYMDKLRQLRKWKKQLFPDTTQQNNLFSVEDLAQ